MLRWKSGPERLRAALQVYGPAGRLDHRTDAAPGTRGVPRSENRRDRLGQTVRPRMPDL